MPSIPLSPADHLPPPMPSLNLLNNTTSISWRCQNWAACLCLCQAFNHCKGNFKHDMTPLTTSRQYLCPISPVKVFVSAPCTSDRPPPALPVLLLLLPLPITCLPLLLITCLLLPPAYQLQSNGASTSVTQRMSPLVVVIVSMFVLSFLNFEN